MSVGTHINSAQTILFWANVDRARNWKNGTRIQVSLFAVEPGCAHSTGHSGCEEQTEHKMLMGSGKGFLETYGD